MKAKTKPPEPIASSDIPKVKPAVLASATPGSRFVSRQPSYEPSGFVGHMADPEWDFFNMREMLFSGPGGLLCQGD
ncbi:hypothetical protein X474_08510 [Dethiosulfatarculus sandiegensis]|uniref:Uncharacterized protein n=1 Tax=Dethiosulfatarculus sandiegensis TaxID=1429043 RepID=A0A0D2HWD0_9BACT|nr:hypothetical protein X474_08510 [Dethiosulfatarculus sandiegensis]